MTEKEHNMINVDAGDVNDSKIVNEASLKNSKADKQVHFRLSKDLMEKLNNICLKEKISQTLLFTNLLKRKVDEDLRYSLTHWTKEVEHYESLLNQQRSAYYHFIEIYENQDATIRQKYADEIDELTASNKKISEENDILRKKLNELQDKAKLADTLEQTNHVLTQQINLFNEKFSSLKSWFSHFFYGKCRKIKGFPI